MSYLYSQFINNFVFYNNNVWYKKNPKKYHVIPPLQLYYIYDFRVYQYYRDITRSANNYLHKCFILLDGMGGLKYRKQYEIPYNNTKIVR